MNELLLPEYKYIIRTDIKPSEIELPIENWRTNPDKDIDNMIKSLARVGLLHPPIISLYKNPKNGKVGAVLDGNRRTFAAQELERGYTTRLNGTKATLYLPENWRFAVLEKTYESLTSEEKDRIRLHSTEQHLHFTLAELKTKVSRISSKYCLDRNLAYSTIRKNSTLFEEMVEYLATYFYMDKKDIIKILKDVRRKESYNERVDVPLHFRYISKDEAKALSQGLKEIYVQPLLDELIETRKQGYTSTQTVPALYATKELLTDVDKDAVDIFREQLNKIMVTRKIAVNVPLETYNKITEERIKKHITLSELIAPLLEKHFP